MKRYTLKSTIVTDRTARRIYLRPRRDMQRSSRGFQGLPSRSRRRLAARRPFGHRREGGL